jgi:O-antigen/teichoic acid export membrane protein
MGSAGLLALGSLFTQAAQIVSLGVLARLVGKADLATYQQLNLLYAVCAPLLLAGVPTGVLYFVSRAETADERRVWILRAYVVLGSMGVLAACGTVLLRHPIAELFNNPRLADALVLYAPYLLFAFIAAATPPALVAAGAPARAAMLNAALGGFMLVALVTAALLEPSARALAVGLSASGAALAVVSLHAVSRVVGIARADPHMRDGLRALLAYGLPLTLAGLAATIGFQFDRIVVGASFSPEDFAVYALGAVEIPLGLLLGQAVTNVLIPRLSELWRSGDPAGMVALWRGAMQKMSLVLLPLFVFLMVMADDVVYVLYGPGYEESVLIFRIYLTLIPLRVATWGVIPTAIGRTSMHAGAAAILLVANAVIALTTVEALGLAGPALAAPIATLLAAVYYVLRLRGVVGAGVTQLVPFGLLTQVFAVVTIAAIPLILIRAVGVNPLVRLILAACAYALVVVPALRLTRLLADDDWARLRIALAGAWRRRPWRSTAAP